MDDSKDDSMSMRGSEELRARGRTDTYDTLDEGSARGRLVGSRSSGRSRRGE